jgi:hypothetical protein
MGAALLLRAQSGRAGSIGTARRVLRGDRDPVCPDACPRADPSIHHRSPAAARVPGSMVTGSAQGAVADGVFASYSHSRGLSGHAPCCPSDHESGLVHNPKGALLFPIPRISWTVGTSPGGSARSPASRWTQANTSEAVSGSGARARCGADKQPDAAAGSGWTRRRRPSRYCSASGAVTKSP